MAQSEPEKGVASSPARLASTSFALLTAAQLGGAAVEEALRPLGIRTRHHSILSLLLEAGPQAQIALSERLRIDRTSMVTLVDQLEGQGLVLRKTAPGDRRAYRVEITAEGEQLLAEAELAISEAEAILLAPLTPKQRKRLQTYLQRIAGVDTSAEE